MYRSTVVGASSIFFISALATLAVGCSSADSKESGTAAALPLTTTPTSASAAAAEKSRYLSQYIPADAITHSFHAHEGMWVDCVDIHRQPGLAPGQKVATPPAKPATREDGTDISARAQGRIAQQDVALHANELDESGNIRHCDPGTVPIRRTTAADLDRFATLRDFYSKSGNSSVRPFMLGSRQGTTPSIAGFEYARHGQDVTNRGLQFFLNIWAPSVESNNDHTISQMWIANLTQTTETAEAGWIVNPAVYGDTRSRLFVYWTDDNYASTGCYDLTCTGFVQTDNSVVLGGTWDSNAYSQINGTQWWVRLAWGYTGTPSPNWWLLYQGTWVGYYPASIYQHGMGTQASVAVYGGEVYNSEPNGRHTQTQMGSGGYASGGFAAAAYQAGIAYIDTNFYLQDTVPDSNWTTSNSGCYSDQTGWETCGCPSNGQQDVPQDNLFQFFGGPGYSANNCP